MSFIAKVEWVDKIGRKYDDYDAYALYYEEIDPALIEIKAEIVETKLIMAWLLKSNDAKYSDALAATGRLEEYLGMVLDEILERKDHLERIKQSLEDEEESDEEYFDRTYGRRPEKEKNHSE